MKNTTEKRIRIYIPTPLRLFTEGQTSIEIEGDTVGEILSRLIDRYPKLKPNLYDAAGKLRSFVNIYVGDEDIRYLQKEATPLLPGVILSIIPSIAGGVL